MELGGKARALERLQAAGFKVPRFFTSDTGSSQEEICAKIEQKLPGIVYFAVRSSAQGEDSSTRSFAGHFYSAIGVAKNDVYREVLKVRESYGDTPGSVIVQEFIPSETAGVLFSEVDGKNIVINATIGLCEPVVNGRPCDEYICSKHGEIIRKTVQEKMIGQFIDGCIVSKKTEEESLNVRQIEELCALAEKLQELFKSPQDVEWCFKDGALYALQSRPITRDFSVGKLEYFDSANIAESYSGIVLPLTCSFAQMVYARVYTDLLHMSGVSKRKLARHADVFDGLLGFFYGRMYYNMNNWYRMAEFVPGYRRNKQNFELMITSNIKAEVTTAIRPSTMLTVGYPFIVAAKVAMYGLTAAHFKSSVKKHLQYLRTHDFGTLDYSECVDLFEELNRKLLRRWYVTLENDFFVMTYLGILKKMLPEEKMQRALIFPSKATEQVTALAALSLTMRKEKDLWQAVESTDIARFERELGRYPKINQMLSEYLHTFGGRFANELKLESRGVDEDPSKLLAVLKIYQDYVPRASPISFETELSPFRKIIFKLVLHKFKKYASRREEFRLLRSNTFAMARKLFRRMGSILQSEGLIEGADDVFYLHLSEILEKGSKSHLRTIVHRRKEEYDSFKSITPPSHFSTINKAPPSAKKVSISGTNMIQGRPASPGRIKGEVRVFKDFSMPLKVDFDILVTSHTDPGWTSLIALSKGLIIEHGGVLSHASIVARELGIPAVIGASDAVTLLRDHLIVEIDGSSGMITILDHAN